MRVTFPEPVVVWARVTQGRAAVLEANVTAIVSLPTERDPVTLPLMDHGIGKDNAQDDDDDYDTNDNKNKNISENKIKKKR